MAWAEAWQKIRYRHLLALRLAGQTLWLYQNPGLIPRYQQKKRRWIIKKKSDHCKTTWIGTSTTYRRVTRAALSSSSSPSRSSTTLPVGQIENSGKEGTTKEEKNKINDMLT
jgi:hypothetical protein